MTLEEAKDLLIPVHGALGGLGLILGLIAFWAKKQKGRHTKFGTAFVILMFLAIMVSVPVIYLSENIFLGGLGSIAFYLVMMGWRIGKIRPPLQQPTIFDKGISLLGFIAFSLFACFGIMVVFKGNFLGLVIVGLGYLGAKMGWDHFRFFQNPNGERGSWALHHGSSLGGGIIAAIAAFSAAALTNYVPQIPEFIVWLAPVGLMIPQLRKQLQGYK